MAEILEQTYQEIIQQINAQGAIQKALEKLIPEQNEKFKILYAETIKEKEISLQKALNKLMQMTDKYNTTTKQNSELSNQISILRADQQQCEEDQYVKFNKMERDFRQKLQQMINKYEEQLKLRTLEQNKNKVLNDDLNKKQKQIDEASKTIQFYKQNDELLTTQQTQISEQLLSTQKNLTSESAKNEELQKQWNILIQENHNLRVLINQKDDQINFLTDSFQKLQFDFSANHQQLTETKQLLQEQQNQNLQFTNDLAVLRKKDDELTFKFNSLQQDSASLKEYLKKANDQIQQLKEENKNLEDCVHQVTLKQLEQENTLKILQQQNDEFKIIIKQQNEELKKFKYQQSEIQKLEQELGCQKQQLEEKIKQFNEVDIKLTHITQDNENFKYQIILQEREMKQKDDEIQSFKSKIAN